MAGNAATRTKRLVAFIVVDPAHAPDAGELRHFCEECLPSYMVPSTFVILDRLPLMANGKTDRQALASSNHGTAFRGQAYALPETEIERTVAAIWRAALEIPEPGVDDNFFELGGHSLLLVRVHSNLKQRFDTQLEIVDLFRYPTIRSLATALHAEQIFREGSQNNNREVARR